MKSIFKSKKLEDISVGRDNNLNLIRFIAAALVIYCHSFPFTYGPLRSDWLSDITSKQINLGGIAVSFFFLYGGFLICKSLDRTRDGKKYFLARIKRIFPPLIAVVFVSAFVMGPLITSLSFKEYFTSAGTYKYLLNCILIPVHNLPGVFENNIYGQAVNGSLWTLPVEFMCYILCFLFWKLGFMNEKKAKYTIPVIAVGCFVGTYFLSGYSPVLAESIRPVMLFYIGMLAYIYRGRIYMDLRIFMIALAGLVLGMVTPCVNIFMYICFPYVAMYLGYATKYKFSKFGKKAEISYGIYLCGAPVQQILVMLLGAGISQNMNAFLGLFISILCGFAIFFLIERPLQQTGKKANTSHNM